MKTKYLLLVMMLCLFGCALFQKTSKTTSVAKQSSINQLESSQLVLKNADKETQIFTYWNDSGFYQFQHIKERIDQAESGNVRLIEMKEAKQKQTAKEKVPVKIWIYMVLIGIIIAFFILIRIRK